MTITKTTLWVIAISAFAIWYIWKVQDTARRMKYLGGNI